MQLKSVLLYGAGGLACLPAFAQPAANAGVEDPRAPVPAVKYESAFTGYTSYRDEKLAPWRDVNDEVGRVGGHIGIFRGSPAAPGKPQGAAGGTPASASPSPADRKP